MYTLQASTIRGAHTVQSGRGGTVRFRLPLLPLHGFFSTTSDPDTLLVGYHGEPKVNLSHYIRII